MRLFVVTGSLASFTSYFTQRVLICWVPLSDELPVDSKYYFVTCAVSCHIFFSDYSQ